MIAFYFFNSAEFQDMLAPLIEVAKSGREVWVCFFDCLEKKRFFFNYRDSELKLFIKSIFDANDLPCPNISFYGHDCHKNFKIDYEDRKPQTVFIQGVYHKYPKWMPHAESSKVVHFAWGADGLQNLKKSNFKVDFNVLRNSGDAKVFKHANCDSKYFGKFWMDQLSHVSPFDDLSEILAGKKCCFIPETWVFDHVDGELRPWNSENVHVVNEFIKFLHDHDYTVICKRREKGYPFHNTHGWSNYVSEKPDLIIEKDLYYPSSLFKLPSMVDACVIFGYGTPGSVSLYEMMKNLNSKTVMANSLSLSEVKDFILNNTADYNNIIPNSSSGLLIEYLEAARILEAT